MKNRLIGEIIENSNITLNTARHNRHQAGEHFDMGLTCDYDILCTVKGGYEYQVNGKAYRPKVGEILLVPSGCRFSGQALEDSAHYFCHFSPDRPLISNAGICCDPEICRLFHKLCSEGSEAFLLKCVIKLVLYRLAQNSGFRYVETIPDGIRQAVQYIEKNPCQSITGKELASIAGMNYSYFSRRFRESMGISPLEYRDKLRLEEAKRLILQGMSVSETAERMGFSDMFAFSKKFKKHFKMSPSKFRQLNI